MCKILIVFTLFLLNTLAASGQTIAATDSSKPLPESSLALEGNNAKVLTQAIVSKFLLEVYFNDSQKQKLRETVSNYMDEKAKIIPLIETDNMQYRQKHLSYFKTLTQKLSSFLSRQQMTSLFALKPRQSDLANSLHYFYY